MKNYLKTKKLISFMNKGFIFFSVLLLSLFSANALDLYVGQSENLVSYNGKSDGNTIINSIAGHVNNPYITPTNQTYYYDFDLELSGMNEEFYLIVENYFINQSLTIWYYGDLARDGTLYVQEVILNEDGRYLFKFKPDYANEGGHIYFGFEEDSFVGTMEYVEKKPEGFNALMGTFLGSFQEIIYINITLWQIMFYTLIFIITVAFIGSLFGGSFWLLNRAKQIREKGL